MKLPSAYWISSSALSVIGIVVMTIGGFQMADDYQNGVTQTIEVNDIQSVHTYLPRCQFQLIASEQAETATVELKKVPTTINITSEDGILSITDKKWRDLHFFNFGFNNLIGTVTVTLPPEEYSEIILSSGYGDQNLIQGIHAEHLEVKSGAGEWLLEQTETETLFLQSGAGDRVLHQVSVSGNAKLDSGAGDTEIKDCTFGEFIYSQGAGNLTGSMLEVQGMTDIESGAGDFSLDRCSFQGDAAYSFGTGDLELINMTLLGNMNISCGAGDVTLGILGSPENYRIDCSDRVGSSSVNGNSISTLGYGNETYQIVVDGTGDTEINFQSK